MRRKFSIAAVFVVLLAAGAGTAALTAGAGPTSVQDTTTITTTITTGTTTTVATITTTTPVSTSTASTTTTSTTTAQPPAPKKITICHHVFRAKSTKHVTIRINRSAWPAHRRHGDSIGSCTSAAAKKFHSRKAHVAKFHHGRRK